MIVCFHLGFMSAVFVLSSQSSFSLTTGQPSSTQPYLSGMFLTLTLFSFSLFSSEVLVSLWSLYVPFSPVRPLFRSVTLPYWSFLSCPEKDNLNLYLVLYLISLILISLCCCLVVLLLHGLQAVLYPDKFSDKRLDFCTR